MVITFLKAKGFLSLKEIDKLYEDFKLDVHGGNHSEQMFIEPGVKEFNTLKLKDYIFKAKVREYFLLSY